MTKATTDLIAVWKIAQGGVMVEPDLTQPACGLLGSVSMKWLVEPWWEEEPKKFFKGIIGVNDLDVGTEGKSETPDHVNRTSGIEHQWQ